MYCKKKAFTLIELLVVIAIIALLMGILLPALNMARSQARAIQCQSRMRQWAVAVTTYISDNDGRMPYYAARWDLAKGDAKEQEDRWYYKVGEYMDIRSSDTARDAKLMEVRKCPGGKYQGDDRWAKWDYWEGWIGAHKTGANNDPDDAPFVTGDKYIGDTVVKKGDPVILGAGAASWIMFIDSKVHNCYNPHSHPWQDRDGDGYGDGHPALSYEYNGANPKVHNGSANIALCDGHVERLGYETLWKMDDRGKPEHRYWYKNR